MTGTLFAVVGPSGSGKDTLIRGAVAADPALHWARRVITRAEVAGGEPYEGVSEAEFARRVAAGGFALHWRAHGLGYGVPRGELDPLGQGRDVIVNGSRAALGQALEAFPALVIVSVTAPARALADRLAQRGREVGAAIAERLDRTVPDLPLGALVLEVANDGTPAEGTARLAAALQAGRGKRSSR